MRGRRWRFGFRCVMALTVLAVVALWAAAASAAYVTWHSDGSASIRTLDGEVINFAPGELGTLFGPGKQPFRGKTIAITVNAAGPKGGISGPLYQLRPAWEELTGAKLDIVEIPFAEHYTKFINDLRLGIGQYDGAMVGAWWYGDLIAGNFIIPIDKYINDPRFPKWDPSALPPSIRTLYTWGGKWYGVLNDSDGQVLYYRKDILTDPKWRQAYKQATGKDLNVPPRSWQELLEISRFFTGKDWNNDGEPDHGIVLHLKVGEQGMFHFMSLSASFVVNPGPKVDRYHNVYWFDPETMEPLINSPGHVRALEFLIELAKTGPAAQVGWSLGEAWDYFLRGKAIFVFSWGDVGALVQDPSRSRIKGKLGASILPGSEEVYDLQQRRWVRPATPNVVGNTTGGSWHGVISALSRNPEVVYSFYALMATKPVSLWNANRGWTGVDPGVKFHFLPPQGTASLQDYLAQGWNENDLKEYLKAYYDNFYAPTILTYLRIPGTFEYWTILDQNLSAAMSGQLTPKEALDRTARQWNEVTNRLGRQEQLRLYREAIGYQP